MDDAMKQIYKRFSQETYSNRILKLPGYFEGRFIRKEIQGSPVEVGKRGGQYVLETFPGDLIEESIAYCPWYAPI